MKERRLCFHLEPPDGWLNDPNGLCYFAGRYHVFFQYSPKSPEGETPRCWGHYSSEDMIDWRYDGIAVRPACRYDRDGAYSGSAIEKDGELYLYYTGNVMHKGDYDYITRGREQNVICVHSADGQVFDGKRLLMTNADFPDDMTCHVRDPKVWKQGGAYKMILGARTAEGVGCALIYESVDGLKWRYSSRLGTQEYFGYMWECPDLFELGGKEVLSVCPQGLIHCDSRFCNVYQSGYFFTDDMTPFGFTEWDTGFDFYAPQTFLSPDGRRIMIGWLGMTDCEYTSYAEGFERQHCLSVPCELTVKNGKICRFPIKELEKLRKECYHINSTGVYNVRLPFEISAYTQEKFCITLGSALRLSFDGGIFLLEHFDVRASGGRTSRKTLMKNCQSIRALFDTTAVEIYLNGGEAVVSTRFFPEEEEFALAVTGVNGKLFKL